MLSNQTSKKVLNSFVIGALSAIIMATPSISTAHDDAYLDSQKTPHGGQMRMAGMYHFELVLAKDAKADKETAIIVYITDHTGNKIPSTGANATITILSGKDKVSTQLKPEGDNVLKGSAKYTANKDLKGVLIVTLAGKHQSKPALHLLILRKIGVAKKATHKKTVSA